MNKATGIASTESEKEIAAEARLWRAVILSTIQDWVSGPLRLKCEAEQYMFGDDSDFRLVCQSAGMDVHWLRSRLVRLREREMDRRLTNKNCAIPA